MSLHGLFARSEMLTQEERQLVCAEAVAQIAHAANAEHNRMMGETHVLWTDLDPKTRRSIVNIVLHIANSNGCVTPEELHNSWMEFKLEAGWIHAPGPVDRDKKTHPCLVPWEKLTRQQKLKDVLFYNIVNTYCVMPTATFQEQEPE